MRKKLYELSNRLGLWLRRAGQIISDATEVRTPLGLFLLRAALCILPCGEWEKDAILRSLPEQREYERYNASCLMLSQIPLPIERWREQSNWIRIKTARAMIVSRLQESEAVR